eukprot:gnl/TRDRNA2_/TRDRNA2_83475_c0_seq1.p1 gnl/TRDRNA2_/TRDRNA2_83475_c0~~gnl/TRDRNA2_/TRDRNA2_83475_c0_seq1.p1  ORF type:complete len:105 (+),score=15.70 gnl/TRDRNA2_/TRDRNA2_83475_c0_seq1:76-390(+)
MPLVSMAAMPSLKQCTDQKKENQRAFDACGGSKVLSTAPMALRADPSANCCRVGRYIDVFWRAANEPPPQNAEQYSHESRDREQRSGPWSWEIACDLQRGAEIT